MSYFYRMARWLDAVGISRRVTGVLDGARSRRFVLLLIGLLAVLLCCHFGYVFDSGEMVARHGVQLSADKAAMMQTLTAFVNVMHKHNISYFLAYGTLLGSFRHHGPIPWDDDMDIICNASDRSALMKAVRTLAPSYTIQPSGREKGRDDMWKFFPSSNSETPSHGFLHRPYRWPFVDVFFLADNRTHVWIESRWLRPGFIFSKDVIYPLQTRPFAGLMIATPCDGQAVLTVQFGVDVLQQCITREHSHRLEIAFPRFMTRRVPCKQLAQSYPFVQRTQTRDYYNETLKMGDWSLQTIRIPRCKTSPAYMFSPK